MPFTQTDLDGIRASLASGELTARVGERLVTYRSVSELLRAKQVIEQELAQAASNPGPAVQGPRYGVFTVRFGTSRGG